MQQCKPCYNLTGGVRIYHSTLTKYTCTDIYLLAHYIWAQLGLEPLRAWVYKSEWLHCSASTSHVLMTKALFHEWVPQSWQFHIEEHSPLSSLGINHAENWKFFGSQSDFPAFGKLRFQERSLLPLDSGQDERDFEFHPIQKTIFGNLWNTSQESKHRKMKLKHYSNQQKNNRKSIKIIAMFHVNLFQANSSLTSVVMRNACAMSPNISLGLRLGIHQLLPIKKKHTITTLSHYHYAKPQCVQLL